VTGADVMLATGTRGRTAPSRRDLTTAYNLEAETGLVGHLLLHGPSPEIRTTLQPEAFHRPAHKITAAIIYDLADEGRPTDAVTVHDETTRRGLPGLDLPELIAAVADASLPASTVAHAQIVADWSAARAVMGIAAELDRAAATGHIDEAAQHASEQLLALGQHAGTPGQLLIEDIAVVAARADAASDVRWLARPIWPGDAYGMLAAGWKVGKTWFVWDLAVSVASGGAWLGAYPVETQGPVLMFLGEGGERKMTRRGRAVAEAKGLKLEDLPIRACHRAPNLTSADHLEQIRREVRQSRPVLVIVDPLYLAAGNANSADLFAMGDVLVGLQVVCQETGAALVIAHHWNRKTGIGDGPDRMTGAGPAEWGRVLVSVSVKHKVTKPDHSTVATLAVTFMGDEIPDTELHLRRRVWADDPDDLASPLHYEVEVLAGTSEEATAGTAALRPSQRRVLAVLRTAGDWLDVREIGDRLAVDDSGLSPLRKRTIQDSLKALSEAGLACPDGAGPTAHKWRAQLPESEAENAF
jgi:hypothetical protein